MDIYEPRLLMEAYSEVYQSQDVDNELYEQVVEFLINEGYAEDQDDADALIEELSDEEIEGILSEANRGEQRVGGRGLEPILVRSNRNLAYAGRPTTLRQDDTLMRQHNGYVSGHRRKGDPRLASKHPRVETHTSARGKRKQRGLVTSSMRGPNPNVSNYYAVKGVDEQLDTYDLVLDHLISEGYADTEDAALQIMAHMSEEWVDGIIDEELTGSRREVATRLFKKYGAASDPTSERKAQALDRVISSREGSSSTTNWTGNRPTKRGGSGEKGEAKTPYMRERPTVYGGNTRSEEDSDRGKGINSERRKVALDIASERRASGR